MQMEKFHNNNDNINVNDFLIQFWLNLTTFKALKTKYYFTDIGSVDSMCCDIIFRGNLVVFKSFTITKLPQTESNGN